MTSNKKSRIIDIKQYKNVLVTALVAFLLNFSIELMNHRSVIKGLEFIFLRPHFFLLGFVVIAFTLSFSLLFKKRKAWLILLSVIWAGVGITDFILRFSRITPFAATDIALMESVWSIMFVYFKIWQLILIAVAIIAVITGLVLIFVRSKKEKVDFKIAACAIAITVALLFVMLCIYNALGIIPNHFPNLQDAYSEYGFSYCFSVGIFDRGIDRPDDYSKENVDDILGAIGASRNTEKTRKPDIIFVQLESFFDANYIRDYTYSENPIPNFTSLKENCSTGFLTVPSVGSGTANTEFEVISGMSLSYFGSAEYPYKTVMQEATCETVCYNLKEQGYSCHAVHNHSGTFYDRNKVFANLGFDTFTSVEYMQGVEFNPIGWAKDSVLTDEIIGVLDSTPGQDLVYAISVQAHGRYPTEPLGDYEKIKVYGTDDEERQTAVQYYVNQLSETDAFIGELTRALEERDNPVILVLFGDHLPTLELTEEELSCGNLFQTEYVVWTNFEHERTVKDLDASQLSAYALGIAGFSNGIFTKLHQNYSGNENYYDALEMLEYDVLYGNYNAYNGKQRYLPTDIRMGYRDIVITGVLEDDERVTVKGENFTPYSAVIVDGRKLQTEFIDSETLTAYERNREDPEEPREYTVGQYTKNGELVSEVKAFAVAGTDG